MADRVHVSPPRSATGIVATLGPASSSEPVLRRLLQAGASIVRFNMSHGTHALHAIAIARVRKVARELGRPVALLVDLQGPKIRTRENAGNALIRLKRGDEISVAAGPGPSRAGHIVVDSPRIVADPRPGDAILLDDGKMVLRIEKRRSTHLVARVERGGLLKPRAGVNVPDCKVRVAIPTAKDRRDAAFAVAQGVDFVALSFVQSAREVRRLRGLLERTSKEGSRTAARKRETASLPAIVAKLEKPAALDDLDAILGQADGVMVARGDLGVELSLERVPIWQKEIIRRARARGVFTITATQMLESMIASPSPTRAEVSDAANSIFDGTDAMMLSAETAIGEYPVEAVQTLARIAREVDAELPRFQPPWIGRRQAVTELPHPVEAVVRAGAELADQARARWILIFTMRGRTVWLLARHRPRTPIIAATPHEAVRRRLCLAWNTRTLVIPPAQRSDVMMRRGIDLLRRGGLVAAGDLVVIVAGDAGAAEATNLLRLVRVKP